jgi:hypothetical protein
VLVLDHLEHTGIAAEPARGLGADTRVVSSSTDAVGTWIAVAAAPNSAGSSTSQSTAATDPTTDVVAAHDSAGSSISSSTTATGSTTAVVAVSDAAESPAW